MTRAQALAKARKLLGDAVELREHPSQPSKAEQVILQEELKAHRGRKPEPPPPSPEVLAYRAAYAAWKAREGMLVGQVLFARREVYEVIGVGLHKRADGDTWAECIDKLANP